MSSPDWFKSWRRRGRNVLKMGAFRTHLQVQDVSPRRCHDLNQSGLDTNWLWLDLSDTCTPNLASSLPIKGPVSWGAERLCRLWTSGMWIHIRPVARGDKNSVRAIVNQHVTSPAGDWFPVRSADHVWLFTHNCRPPHSIFRRRRRGALQSIVSAHTWLCLSETFTFEEHWSAYNSRFGTLKSE